MDRTPIPESLTVREAITRIEPQDNPTPPEPAPPEPADSAKPPDLDEPFMLSPDAPPPTDPVEAALAEVVESMRKRHPAIRTAGPAVVGKRLVRILNYRKITKPAQKIRKLREIDANHAAHCETTEWRKNNGQYAPKLEKWLAASELRYEDPPPPDLKTYTASEYEEFPKD